MKKCQGCIICPFIREIKILKGDNFVWKLASPISCISKNLVYLIECEKERCRQKYIGETERTLKDRVSEHVSYIRSKNITQATGFHFNLPGHSLSDMKVSGLELIRNPDSEYRKERESYIIRKFNTFYKGINRIP